MEASYLVSYMVSCRVVWAPSKAVDNQINVVTQCQWIYN